MVTYVRLGGSVFERLFQKVPPLSPHMCRNLKHVNSQSYFSVGSVDFVREAAKKGHFLMAVPLRGAGGKGLDIKKKKKNLGPFFYLL